MQTMLQDRHILIRRIIINAMLVSFALVLSYIESFIPMNYLYMVPGLKLGLANIPVMFALYVFSVKDGVIIATLKIILTALLFGSPISFIFSLTGTVFSVVLMILLKSLFIHNKITFIGISCVAAVFFNIGQLTAAAVMFKSLSPFVYIPFLIFGGVIFGIICGILLNSVMLLISKKTKMFLLV